MNPLKVDLVSKVAQENFRGVAHAHKAKMRKYWDHYEAEGITFFPLAADTFGGWHEAGQKTLTKLGRQLARATGREEGLHRAAPEAAGGCSSSQGKHGHVVQHNSNLHPSYCKREI